MVLSLNIEFIFLMHFRLANLTECCKVVKMTGPKQPFKYTENTLVTVAHNLL